MKALALSTLGAALLSLAAISFPSTPASAVYDYPWCARLAGFGGSGPSCRYSTYDQCYAATVQLNGWCERNPRLVEQEQQSKRR